ncbi:hypothetical protein B4099_1784 [Heyndrickxia coagulans]|uniref:Uncharacterized protein n=1 Tax=Heyndrickxia coagulans TaxID=1398 RepID=A0A150K4V0_HEYCO|nr:hypothetical protein B4099_1784 [Heyndrickxia coagulans]
MKENTGSAARSKRKNQAARFSGGSRGVPEKEPDFRRFLKRTAVSEKTLWKWKNRRGK